MQATTSLSKILVPALVGAVFVSGCVRQNGDTGEEMTTVFSDSDSESDSSGSSGPTTLGTTTSTVTTEPLTTGEVSSTTSSDTDATEGSSTTENSPCNYDAVCDGDETPANCLHDCGECEADGVCDEDETPYSCPADCAATDCNSDGIIDPLTEQCDDDNQDQTDFCTNACGLNICGDGLLYPESQGGTEECDDGNLEDNDGCSSTCSIEHRRVFVSSTLFTGDMGPAIDELQGLDLADAHCQELAESASKEGTYKAWLSDGQDNPETRFGFSSFTGVFELVDGSPIATGWDDLTDGELMQTIDIDETGKAMQLSLVWTNTATTGTSGGVQSCSSWTTASASEKGLAGANEFKDAQWTDFNSNSCAGSARIYCFQVQ